MEHIVQFGINVDDTAIKKAIENNVMTQVAGAIKNDTMKVLVGRKECSNIEYAMKLREIIIDTTDNFLNINKDKIIEMVSDKLVEKAIKAKAFKETINKVFEETLK